MASDTWEDIINLMTGYTLPKRADITGIKGDSGSVWINVSIKSVTTTLQLVQTQHPDGKGWTFEFYSSGSEVQKYQADITYPDLGPGADFYKRGTYVLNKLTTGDHTSNGSDGGVGGAPEPSMAVDLHSFTDAAKAFDLAGAFFKGHTATLGDWRTALGDENAAWKGNAAGVFWHLVDDLHTKYDNFTAELQPPGFAPLATSPSTGYQSTTLHGDSLIAAEVTLHDGYSYLASANADFVNRTGPEIKITNADGTAGSYRPSADPRDILNEVMLDIANWINKHNASNVYQGKKYRPNYLASSTEEPGAFHTRDGFSEQTVWGALKDTSQWAAAANEAVDRWTKNVKGTLDGPGRDTISFVQRYWSRVLDSNWNTGFAFEDTTNTSLSAEAQQDAVDAANAAAGGDGGDDGGVAAFIAGLNNFAKSVNDFGNGLNKFANGVNNFGNGLNEFANGVNNFGNGLNNFANGPDQAGYTITKNAGKFGDGTTDFGNNLGNGPEQAGYTITNGLNNFGAGTNYGTGATGLPTGGTPGGLPPTLPIFTRSGKGTTTTLDPNGDQITRNADGSVTTTFPDGSSRTVGPDGNVTTTAADGTTTTSHLGSGQTLTNPDGSTVTLNADGSITQTNPDGSHTTTFPNGTTETTTADGLTHITAPDGVTSAVNADGSLTTDFPGHGSVTVHPNGDVTTTGADGSTSTSHLDPGKSLTNPDGSTTSVDAKGDIVTTYPDGSSTTLHPDGTVTTAEATLPTVHNGIGGNGPDVPGAGSTVLPHLPHLPSHVDLPTEQGAGQISHLPDGTTVTTGADGSVRTSFPDGSGTVTTPDGQFQALPSPDTAAATAAGAPFNGADGFDGSDGTQTPGVPDASSESSNAMGLLSPMMMMAGMSRMGGQQGGGGQERVRQTYEDDSDGAFIQHAGLTRPQSVRPPEESEDYEEEEEDPEELLGRRRPTESSPYSRPGAARPATQSSGSAGSSWSNGQEDVWGTDEGGLPASIGY